MLAQTTTFLLCTSSPAHRSYTTFIDHLQTEMDGRRDAQPGSNAPLRASPRVASDRRWCLWGILDHTGGPARSSSTKPISGVAPALLPFYPFSCAVVRVPRMTHWWRILKPNHLSALLDESNERGLSRFRSWLRSQPGIHPAEIERGGREDLLEMNFLQTTVTGLT